MHYSLAYKVLLGHLLLTTKVLLTRYLLPIWAALKCHIERTFLIF